VALITEHGYGVSETARHFGMNTHRLRKWQRQLEDNPTGALPGKGRLSAAPEDRHRVRQANKRVRRERDLVKTAALCFANESRCGTP
jgi:transposase